MKSVLHVSQTLSNCLISWKKLTSPEKMYIEVFSSWEKPWWSSELWFSLFTQFAKVRMQLFGTSSDNIVVLVTSKGKATYAVSRLDKNKFHLMWKPKDTSGNEMSFQWWPNTTWSSQLSYEAVRELSLCQTASSQTIGFSCETSIKVSSTYMSVSRFIEIQERLKNLDTQKLTECSLGRVELMQCIPIA